MRTLVLWVCRTLHAPDGLPVYNLQMFCCCPALWICVLLPDLSFWPSLCTILLWCPCPHAFTNIGMSRRCTVSLQLHESRASLLTGREGRSRGKAGADRAREDDRERRVLEVRRSSAARSGANGVAKDEAWGSDEEGEGGARSEASASASGRRSSRSGWRGRGAVNCPHCGRDGHRWACTTPCCSWDPAQPDPLQVPPSSRTPGCSPAGCLRACRVMGCPELKGFSNAQRSVLNQAYLGGSSVPSVDSVLERLGLRNAGLHSKGGEAGATEHARGSRGHAPDECCLHCKEPGHRCGAPPQQHL